MILPGLITARLQFFFLDFFCLVSCLAYLVWLLVARALADGSSWPSLQLFSPASWLISPLRVDWSTLVRKRKGISGIKIYLVLPILETYTPWVLRSVPQICSACPSKEAQSRAKNRGRPLVVLRRRKKPLTRLIRSDDPEVPGGKKGGGISHS